MKLLYFLRQLLFPPKCMLCRKTLRGDETDLCHSCRTSAPVYPFGLRNPEDRRKNGSHFLDSFTAVWYYEGNVRKSLHRFKFRNQVHLAPKFGRLVAVKLMEQGMAEADVLTWAPVSKARRRRRGYDQGELLAEAVGRELGIETRCLLEKVRDTPAQSGLTSEFARRANVDGAYRTVPGTDLTGKTVILIDDIYTTGSTMLECTKMLKIAGAATVMGASAAAVRRRNK